MSRRFAKPAAAVAIVAWLGAVPAGAIDVLCFGDSMTYGVGDEEGLGYPKRLKKLLGKGSSVKNFGEPADETVLAVSRIGKALKKGADVLLLMEGTNDVTAIARGALSMETTLANLDSMITATLDAGIEPVLASVVPRAPEAKLDRTNAVTSLLAGELRELAVARDVRFADPYDLLDPLVVPEYFDEYYDHDPEDIIGHLNGSGYQKLAQAFADLLEGIDSAKPVVGNFEPGTLPNEIPTGTRIRVPVYDFKGGAGLDREATKLLINGNVVANGAESEGDLVKLELFHRAKKTLGCRAVLRVLAQDLASPPNVLDRTIAIYGVTGRTVLPGDVDFDCHVDGADLVSFALNFGRDSSDPLYLTTWDFNRDGIIDDVDLETLAKNFGKSSL